MKIALVDLETTGLDAQKHEIIEIGCIVFDSETCVPEFGIDIKLLPEHIETALPKALVVNGYNKKDWKDAKTQKEGLQFFANATQGCHFAAHNVTFDWGFMDAKFKEYGITHSFDYHKIDTLSMAYAKIPHSKVSSWSLKTIATYLGVPPEPKIHKAINGAECAFNIYKKLMK